MTLNHTIRPSRLSFTFFAVLLTGCAGADPLDSIDELDGFDQPSPQTVSDLTTHSSAVFSTSTTELTATQDTFILSNDANQTRGGGQLLRMRREGDRRVLVSFDAASIDAAVGDDILLSATLVLPIELPAENWTPQGGTIDLHRMTTAWTEDATWNCPADTNPGNNQADCAAGWSHDPAGTPPYELSPSASVLVSDGDAGTLEFDVTEDVLVHDVGMGWLLKRSQIDQPGRIRFTSTESGAGPTLVLDVLADECPDDPNKTEAGICGCGVPEAESQSECLTACPVYSDPLAYMQGIIDSTSIAQCIDQTVMTCDGTMIYAEGTGNAAGTILVELGRPSLNGYSSAEYEATHCDGLTGEAAVGFAEFSFEHEYTCQMLFDQACATLPAP